MTTDIFKNFTSAMDRQINRKRFLAQQEARDKVAVARPQFLAEQEARDDAAYARAMNHLAEMIASGRAQEIKISDVAKICEPERYLDWDYEPSGYLGEINGDFGS